MSATITKPCDLCGRLLLRSERACATCGAPDVDMRGGGEPTPDELAAELAALDADREEERAIERDREQWEAEHEWSDLEIHSRYGG